MTKTKINWQLSYDIGIAGIALFSFLIVVGSFLDPHAIRLSAPPLAHLLNVLLLLYTIDFFYRLASSRHWQRFLFDTLLIYYR